jgi:hypothetical protein
MKDAKHWHVDIVGSDARIASLAAHAILNDAWKDTGLIRSLHVASLHQTHALNIIESLRYEGCVVENDKHVYEEGPSANWSITLVVADLALYDRPDSAMSLWLSLNSRDYRKMILCWVFPDNFVLRKIDGLFLYQWTAYMDLKEQPAMNVYVTRKEMDETLWQCLHKLGL